MDVVDRAQVMRHAADLLQERLPLFSAALVSEGLKTWNDAVAEVREAIDFLEYYARGAVELDRSISLLQVPGERNVLRYAPRGIVASATASAFGLALTDAALEPLGIDSKDYGALRVLAHRGQWPSPLEIQGQPLHV